MARRKDHEEFGRFLFAVFDAAARQHFLWPKPADVLATYREQFGGSSETPSESIVQRRLSRLRHWDRKENRPGGKDTQGYGVLQNGLVFFDYETTVVTQPEAIVAAELLQSSPAEQRSLAELRGTDLGVQPSDVDAIVNKLIRCGYATNGEGQSISPRPRLIFERVFVERLAVHVRDPIGSAA